ncbi:MAG: hypothetical protein ACLR01_03320 [Vescimonas sp.]
MDNNGKSRHSVWLSDEVWQEVDAFYKLDNCPTRNEFVEKALRQYCGRLHAERSVAYLPRALQEMLEGTLGVFGDRLGKLLFKLVVEHNMTNHLLGGDIDMTRDEYNKMRGSSVREVASTHGSISFGMCCCSIGRSKRCKICHAVSKEKGNLSVAFPRSLWYVVLLQGGDLNGKTETRR